MRWPWVRRDRLVLTLGDVYVLGAPYTLARRNVRLTGFSTSLDGTVELRFLPDVQERKP